MYFRNILSDELTIFFQSFIKLDLLILIPFLLSFNQMEELWIFISKELVFKEYTFSFSDNFIDFFEFIHIELSNETLNLLVSKVNRQYLSFHPPLIFDLNLTSITSPSYCILKLGILEDSIQFYNKIRNGLFFVWKQIQIEGSHFKNEYPKIIKFL